MYSAVLNMKTIKLLKGKVTGENRAKEFLQT